MQLQDLTLQELNASVDTQELNASVSSSQVDKSSSRAQHLGEEIAKEFLYEQRKS